MGCHIKGPLSILATLDQPERNQGSAGSFLFAGKICIVPVRCMLRRFFEKSKAYFAHCF